MSRLRLFLSVALAVPLVAIGALGQRGTINAATNQRGSHARIVRISLASGTTQINVQDGRGWQRAVTNMPISVSDEVRTGTDGKAEIELEDGSAIRLIPDSTVGFRTLQVLSGTRLTDVVLEGGTAIVSLRGKDWPGFRLITPEGTVSAPDGKAEFRADLVNGGADVQTLDGKITVNNGSQEYLVKKNENLSLVQGGAELAKNANHDDWDRWSKQRDQQTITGGKSLTSSLSSFGDWSTFNGSNCWLPTGMPLGWTPFSNGSWFFDPILGYSWVSPYSWAWYPYHFGTWYYMGNNFGNFGNGFGSGYCWAPGLTSSMWGLPLLMGFYSPVPLVIGPGGGAIAPPAHPAAPTLTQTKPLLPLPNRAIAASLAGMRIGALNARSSSISGPASQHNLRAQEAAMHRAQQTQRWEAQRREERRAAAEESGWWGSTATQNTRVQPSYSPAPRSSPSPHTSTSTRPH